MGGFRVVPPGDHRTPSWTRYTCLPVDVQGDRWGSCRPPWTWSPTIVHFRDIAFPGHCGYGRENYRLARFCTIGVYHWGSQGPRQGPEEPCISPMHAHFRLRARSGFHPSGAGGSVPAGDSSMGTLADGRGAFGRKDGGWYLARAA